MNDEQVDKMLDLLIEREGGLVDHPNDPGGLTKYGISQRRFPNEDIRNLTIPRAKELYVEHFVRPYRIDEFRNEQLAELLLDWVVNGGPAVRSLQQLLAVDVDGVVGNETLAAANAATPDVARQLLYSRMFYFASLTKHPFIKGWLRRLIKLGL